MIHIRNKKQLRDALFFILCGAYGGYEGLKDYEDDHSISLHCGMDTFARFWGAICMQLVPKDKGSHLRYPNAAEGFDSIDGAIEELSFLLPILI